MGIIQQNSRISHHTITTPGASFSVPTQEDFTISGSGSWGLGDLAVSEIGVNEADGRAFLRIGSTIKEFNFTTASTGPLKYIQDSDGVRTDTIEVDVNNVAFGTGIMSSMGATYSGMTFSPDSIVVHSSSGLGITYDQSYSLTFGSYSLVTKEYVDNHVTPVNLLIDIDFTDIPTLISTSALKPGVWYRFNYTESGGNGIDVYFEIYLLALHPNVLSTSGKRLMYVPTVDQYNGAVGRGIYNPNNTYSVGDRVVYQGRIWENTTGNAGTPSNTYWWATTDWSVVPYGMDYDKVFYDIEYAFEFSPFFTGKIASQSDNQGNKVLCDNMGPNAGQHFLSSIEINDWNNPKLFDNTSYGIWGNVSEGTPTEIRNNIVIGEDYANGKIWNNICDYSAFIYGNIIQGNNISNNKTQIIKENVVKDISNNNILVEIRNNVLTSVIQNNHGNYITNNSGGSITSNTVPSIFGNAVTQITGNTITDHIRENVGETITYNNGPTHIQGNYVTTITNNANTGMIGWNKGKLISSNSAPIGAISYNTVGENISDNSNNGDIIYNTMSYRIIDNLNSGSIQSNVGANIENNSNSVLVITTNNVRAITGNYNEGGIVGNKADLIDNNGNIGEINYNNVSASINNNANGGIITQNVCSEIANNSNTGDIQYNYVGSTLSYNTNGDGIVNNDVEEDISYNHNTGQINANRALRINGNSNTGSILNNTVAGSVIGNSNGGNIANNTGTCEISNNSNGGYISFNDVGHMLALNTNTGNIENNRVTINISENGSNIVDIRINTCATIDNNN